MSMGDYVLQVYSNAAGVPFSTVRRNFVARYGEAQVNSLSQMQQGVNYGELEREFRDVISEMPSERVADPYRSDIIQALLDVGGKPPSTVQLVAQAAADTAEQVSGIASGTLKLAVIGALIGGAIYLAITTGYLKNAFGRK